MSETTYVNNHLNDNRLKEAIEELMNVVDQAMERISKIESVLGIEKVKNDIKDLDGSIADVQKRLETLEANQKVILGVEKK